MASADRPGQEASADPGGRRFFVGIGVGSYDDPHLELAEAEEDARRMGEWFTARSGVRHEWALEDLGRSPTATEIAASLSRFLGDLEPDDTVVVYVACHGEVEGAKAHLFGRDTPRRGLAGRSLEAGTLGSIVGQSAPHNVLLVLDACVAGRLGSAVQWAAEAASDELNNRDPHRTWSQVVISSTFGRDPAHDGRFAEAFLRVVTDERWTGTTRAWVDVDNLMRGLNEELKDIAPAQVAERRVWGPAPAELIPNPNAGSRPPSSLVADEEFVEHFGPKARGAGAPEGRSFFAGRHHELRRIVDWLHGADGALLVITGSPGSGKSALLSRAVVLSDPEHRPDAESLAALPRGTVPPEGAFDRVIWCHNKTEREITGEIAAAFGGSATTPEGLLELAEGQVATLAVDALDETASQEAGSLARRVLVPLSREPGIRLLVATRPHPVRRGGDGTTDLLEALESSPEARIDLDRSPEGRADMRAYAAARLREARSRGRLDPDVPLDRIADWIAEAAGASFLVATLSTRLVIEGGSADLESLPRFPTGVAEALGRYIDALEDPATARAVLRPLAWAQGAGLPWGTLWPRLATALARAAGTAGADYGDSEVRQILSTAGDLIVESVDEGQPVYRLFHEALAEELRSDLSDAVAHETQAAVMWEMTRERPWSKVDPYVAAALPLHLIHAGKLDRAVHILGDPSWDRARREQTGNPVAGATVADLAVRSILSRSPTDLRAVPLCVGHSRSVSTAAPLVIDVLARSGQLARAETMARNLVLAPDRMIAFRCLCRAYAARGDTVSAVRCLESVRSSVMAMPPVHRAMAWAWVTEAARNAGRSDDVHQAVQAALEGGLRPGGDGWALPNGCFWAGYAARLGESEAAKARIHRVLDSMPEPVAHRNQSLQAAGVTRHRPFLEACLEAFLDTGARYADGGLIRDGNLALALADAGMDREFDRLKDGIAGEPVGEPDTLKRWAWGLALRGRTDEALQAVGAIHDPVETSKAVARVTDVVSRRDGVPGPVLDALAALAREGLDGALETKVRARLVRSLWMAGERGEALEAAEREIATTHRSSPVTDPRDPDPGGSPATDDPGVKTGRREMVTTLVPVEDEQRSQTARALARDGDLKEARRLAELVEVPVFRAQALAAIAGAEPDGERALKEWLRAMEAARRAGRGLVAEVWPLGTRILEGLGRGEAARTLQRRVDELEARWELESFAEQYESLRRGMDPGGRRTAQMTALMHVPYRQAWRELWTRDDLRAGWASGEDGKRLFVLAVMDRRPELAVPDILVDGIRGSRSAFEQYHALRAAAGAELDGTGREAVVSAIRAELQGEPRPDGVASDVAGSEDRAALARLALDHLGRE